MCSSGNINILVLISGIIVCQAFEEWLKKMVTGFIDLSNDHKLYKRKQNLTKPYESADCHSIVCDNAI